MTKKKKTMPWPLFPRMSIGKDVHLSYSVFLKNPPAEKKKKKRIRLPMQETWIRSLGREDPLEEGMATHSSILA